MNKLLLTLAMLASLQATAQMPDHAHHVTKHHYPHKVVHKRMKTHTMVKHHVVATDNDNHAAYEGKPSRSNDGPAKNKQRNMNYQNNGAQGLPPNNGRNTH